MYPLGLELLPISVVIVTVLTFISSYIISVVDGHVFPYFPYISDTGTKVPESCIFGQFLNISSALSMFSIYIRYKLVTEITRNSDDLKLKRVNLIGLVTGMLAALGISIVGNFQETSVIQMHIVGAMLTFGLGTVYEFIETGLSYYMQPLYNGIYICRVRLSLALSSLSFFITTLVAASATGKNKFNPRQWKSDEPGYVAHVISTSAEWLLALTFLFFFLTFVKEFRRTRMGVAVDVSVTHLDDLSTEVDERSPLVARQSL